MRHTTRIKRKQLRWYPIMKIAELIIPKLINTYLLHLDDHFRRLNERNAAK